MGKKFLFGIGGILLGGIFATLLMVANAKPLTTPDKICAFSSGYGIGATSCDDISQMKASPLPNKRVSSPNRRSTDMVDSD